MLVVLFTMRNWCSTEVKQPRKKRFRYPTARCNKPPPCYPCMRMKNSMIAPFSEAFRVPLIDMYCVLLRVQSTVQNWVSWLIMSIVFLVFCLITGNEAVFCHEIPNYKQLGALFPVSLLVMRLCFLSDNELWKIRTHLLRFITGNEAVFIYEIPMLFLFSLPFSRLITGNETIVSSFRAFSTSTYE